MGVLSVAVMAHPKRAEWVEELAAQLGERTTVVWDQINDRHDTGQRSLEAYDPTATHHLVVQDDAIVCRDLVAGLERATETSGNRVLALYTGATRKYRQKLQQRAALAKRGGSPWLDMAGPRWGVGLVIPTARIPDLLSFYSRSTIENYDRRIEAWVRFRRMECWYTLPSLVEHRHGGENESLVAGRHSVKRHAFRFLGTERSALELDWERVPRRRYPL